MAANGQSLFANTGFVYLLASQIAFFTEPMSRVNENQVVLAITFEVIKKTTFNV